MSIVFFTSLKKKNSMWLFCGVLSAIEKAREFHKNIYFCFNDYAKAFDCVDHNKLWTILREMGIPDHLTCLLRNLYAGQEARVRTRHGTTDCFHFTKNNIKLFKSNYIQENSCKIMFMVIHEEICGIQKNTGANLTISSFLWTWN